MPDGDGAHKKDQFNCTRAREARFCAPCSVCAARVQRFGGRGSCCRRTRCKEMQVLLTHVSPFCEPG
eukprot:3196577-Pleurochrysis_carterae.AAC.1